MLALIKKTCTNVADVHGCRVEFEPYTKVLMEPVINDQEVVEETARKTDTDVWSSGVRRTWPMVCF